MFSVHLPLLFRHHSRLEALNEFLERTVTSGDVNYNGCVKYDCL